MSKIRDKVIHMSTQELRAIFKDKSLTPQDRGEIGERAVSRIGIYWASRFKEHISATSFIFPQGPVLATRNSKAGDEPVTEIDLLLVTPYRVFVIEIKTVYGQMDITSNSEIEISRDGFFEGEYEKKNYFQQNEMHARHLYYHLHTMLPAGSPSYIVPLIIIAGNMSFSDGREPTLAEKYPITTATEMYETLEQLNQPLERLLNVKRIKEKLKEIKVDDFQRLLDSQDFTSKSDKENEDAKKE